MSQQDLWVGEFLPIVARFRNRAIAGGRTGIQPAQAAHLTCAQQIAPARGKVVRQRPRKKSQRIQFGHADPSGLVNHDVLFARNLVLVQGLDLKLKARQFPGRREELCARTALLVRGNQKIGGRRLQTEIADHAAIDEQFRPLNRIGGQQHGNADTQIGIGLA